MGDLAFLDGFAVEFPERDRPADALFSVVMYRHIRGGAGARANAAFRRITGGEFRKPACAAHAAGVHLRCQSVSNAAGPDYSADAATALPHHHRVCGLVLFADDCRLAPAQNQSGGVSAVLSAGHPANR